MLLPFLLRATISLIVTDYIVLARPHLEVEKPRGVASIEVVQECVMTSKSTGSAIFHLRHPGDIIEADHTDKAIEITSLRCGAEYKFGGINSNINEDGEMCQLVNFNDDAAEAFNFQIRDCIPTVKDVLNTSPTKRSLEDGFDRCKDGVEQLATRLVSLWLMAVTFKCFIVTCALSVMILGIGRAVSPYDHAVEFLEKNVQRKYKKSFLECQARLAVLGWQRSPWKKHIPEIMFLNDILPFTSLTEEANDFRGCSSEGSKFIHFMRKIVEKCSNVTCAVETLNRKAWSYTSPPIEYAPGGSGGLNAYNLYDVIRKKKSSCTGLSIFLVSALRSVGVPARIAGTPHWNRGPAQCPHGDMDDACGNHNWVEAYIPDPPFQGWLMVDQANLKSALNHSWFVPKPAIFQNDGTMNHSIYASSLAPTEALARMADYFVGAGNRPSPFGHFPLVWDWNDRSVHAWDQRLKADEDPEKIARTHLDVMSVSNINLAMNKLRSNGSRDFDILMKLGNKLLEFETAKWGRPSHTLVCGRVISDAVYALTKLLTNNVVTTVFDKEGIAKLVLEHAIRVRVEAVKISTGDAACILWCLSRIRPFVPDSDDAAELKACWLELCSYMGRGDIAKKMKAAEVALLCSAVASRQSLGIKPTEMGAVWRHAIVPRLDEEFTARNVVEVADALASIFPEESLNSRPKWAADAGKALAVFTKINLTYFTGQGLSRMMHALVRMQALDSVLAPKAIAVVCNNPELYDARSMCGVAYAITKSGYHSVGLCLKACERVLATAGGPVDAQSMVKLIWCSDVVGVMVPQELWQLASTVARKSERLTATMASYTAKRRGYEMIDLSPAILRGSAQDLSLVLWSAAVNGYVLEEDLFLNAIHRILTLRPMDSQSHVMCLWAIAVQAHFRYESMWHHMPQRFRLFR
ncbi:hypothetical protein FOL47_007657 [Perkinsus chesapeaki]|uniref:Transglutaminase-like domain-containing protein n=1 Tax=Perkinsus chesapeaki TaxID=330153 RepID=A0A7J6MV76_PERCH|nr:hypothetical protein FOL47_007657 [Perkinsus chesapeaki]